MKKGIYFRHHRSLNLEYLLIISSNPKKSWTIILGTFQNIFKKLLHLILWYNNSDRVYMHTPQILHYHAFAFIKSKLLLRENVTEFLEFHRRYCEGQDYSRNIFTRSLQAPCDSLKVKWLNRLQTTLNNNVVMIIFLVVYQYSVVYITYR